MLKQPFILQKVKQLLPDEVLDEEFSHTVFHGKGSLLHGFEEEDNPRDPTPPQAPISNQKSV